MTDRRDHGRDDDLARSFARLRAEEAAQAPPFESSLRPGEGRGRTSLWRRPALAWAAPVAALLLIVVAAVQLRERPAASELGLAELAALESWEAPTDVLLNLPGGDLLETVPSLGAGLLPAPVASPPTEDRRRTSG